MKKLILSITAIAAILFSGYSQCTPDPQYMDSTYGAWPDTITDFPAGQVAVPYSEVLDFKVPADAGEIDPLFSGTPVDSAVLDNVQGLPPGLTYICNNSNCSWLGGAQGCATISGTPTVSGVYDVTINIIGWVTVVIPISQPAPFTGYTIIIDPALNIQLIQKNDFKLKHNSPNPFSETTDIEFVTGKNGQVDFKVMNLLGEVIHSEVISAVPGTNKIEFNGKNLTHGIYVYSLSNGESIVTKRMIKNN